jgi:hypothetical protein
VRQQITNRGSSCHRSQQFGRWYSQEGSTLWNIVRSTSVNSEERRAKTSAGPWSTEQEHPISGTRAELIAWAGIDADDIAIAARELVREGRAAEAS